MNRQKKRIVTAWFLLAVFSLTTSLSVLHTHQPVATTVTDCMECAHHVQHHGHLTVAGETMHDCVLCQFLSLPYIPAIALAVIFSVSFTIVATQRNTSFVCNEVGKAKSTRAPPYYI